MHINFLDWNFFDFAFVEQFFFFAEIPSYILWMQSFDNFFFLNYFFVCFVDIITKQITFSFLFFCNCLCSSQKSSNFISIWNVIFMENEKFSFFFVASKNVKKLISIRSWLSWNKLTPYFDYLKISMNFYNCFVTSEFWIKKADLPYWASNKYLNITMVSIFFFCLFFLRFVNHETNAQGIKSWINKILKYVWKK